MPMEVAMPELTGRKFGDVFHVDIYNGEVLKIHARGGNDAVYANGISDMQGWKVNLGDGDSDWIDLIEGKLTLDGTSIFVGVELMDTWRTHFSGTEADNVFDFRSIHTVAFGGSWSVHVLGNGGNDTIYGGVVGDFLNGGPGSDLLAGESGADTMTGGIGADVFLWNSLDGSLDTIRDFGKGADTLHFASAACNDLLPLGTLDPLRFAETAANAAGPQFIFHASTGILSFDPDGTGTEAEIAIVTLTVAPTASDIVIV